MIQQTKAAKQKHLDEKTKDFRLTHDLSTGYLLKEGLEKTTQAYKEAG